MLSNAEGEMMPISTMFFSVAQTFSKGLTPNIILLRIKAMELAKNTRDPGIYYILISHVAVITIFLKTCQRKL